MACAPENFSEMLFFSERFVKYLGKHLFKTKEKVLDNFFCDTDFFFFLLQISGVSDWRMSETLCVHFFYDTDYFSWARPPIYISDFFFSDRSLG